MFLLSENGIDFVPGKIKGASTDILQEQYQRYCPE
jgi:hypothetical protein